MYARSITYFANLNSKLNKTSLQKKYVLTHTDNIEVKGWRGARAYEISGGANGGFFDNLSAGLLSLTIFLATFPEVGLIALLYIKITIVAAMIALILDTYPYIVNYDYGLKTICK